MTTSAQNDGAPIDPSGSGPRLSPLGDRALLARFPSEHEAAAWAAAVTAMAWCGVVDIVPAYRDVAVFADPDAVDLDDLEVRLRALVPAVGQAESGRRLVIPVVYDGPDLEAIAGLLNVTLDEVVACHTGPVYDVFAIGFLPGFPYAGWLRPPLAGLPRRRSPRTRVPAGSVAVAGRQTGVYPGESPGGWHILGRTPLCLVDVAGGYFPIRAGDQIQFTAITADEYEARLHERL